MKASMSIQLHRLQPLSNARLGALATLMSDMEYSAESTFGFRDIHFEADVLSATLVKQTVTTIRSYDAQRQALVDQEIHLYTEADFALDSRYQLLEVFGPATNASKVRVSLRPFLDRAHTLEAASLAPVVVVPRLVRRLEACEVDRLSVINFEHLQGVLGRYEVRLLTPGFAQDTLARYGHDVTKASLQCSLRRIGAVELVISSYGRLQISGEEETIEPAYYDIKSALFEEE